MAKSPGHYAHSFRGLLLDVYGVLEFKGSPCPGAIEFIEALNKKSIPYRLLTNSTLQSRHSMAEKLVGLGFDVTTSHLVTASSATAAWLRTQNAKSCQVIIDGRGTEEFEGIPLIEGLSRDMTLDEGQVPEYLVLGDARHGFTFSNINIMYRHLIAGATLVMMIPNITSVEKTGPEITVGGYGAMLETASAKPAVRIGKPAPVMFEMALQDMGMSRSEVLMVGDNQGVDIEGARGAGMASALIKTGEHDWPQLQSGSEPHRPEWVIGRLDQLLDLLA